jgi:hypothetical protein
MTDSLAEIKARRASPHPFLTSAQIDWLVAEVELLRQEVFELRIYKGFGQDHGHQRCIEKITWLRGLLGRIPEWVWGCPACGSPSHVVGHEEDCWKAAELARNANDPPEGSQP